MKNSKLIGFLVIFVSSLMFIQCTTDTLVGPPGADGRDGIDGINGTNGQDGQDGQDGVGTASCVACHSDTHREPINASYLLSGHAAGGAVGYAGGRASCSRCHSNEGFINYVTGQPAVNLTGQTAISCTTCHDKHSTFDFENDGYDYALRTFEPVTLMTDENLTIDYGDKSNLCVQCHQPRRSMENGYEDNFSSDGTEFTVTSSHWGPHYGAQSAILEGVQGMELAGSTTYSGLNGNSPHRTGIGETKSSCVVCHMDETSDGTDGAHSWLTSGNACLECHGNVPIEVTGFEEDFATLKTMLNGVAGWEYRYSVLRDGNGEPILDDGDLQFLDINGVVTNSSSAYVIEEDGNGEKIKEEVVGVLLLDGTPNTGFYGRGATFPAAAGKAGWNYRLIYQDHSHGIHNPGYVKALLKNSIEALQ